MNLPAFPLYAVDFIGSLLMIFFSILCIERVRTLRKRDPENVLWLYLLWLCYSLAVFAISRSGGHILQHILRMIGKKEFWLVLQPYTGSLNSITFIGVAFTTLFFERVWKIHKSLKDVQAKLIFMNRNLDQLVHQRTRELNVSERKYRNLFEQSQDIILVVSGDGVLMDANPKGLDVFGWLKEDFGKVTVEAIFVDPRDFRGIWDDLNQYGSINNREVAVRKFDGSMIVLINALVETDFGDRRVFWLRDISERKLMEKKLLQADKLSSIGRLAAGIAHEINNPLGVILGYTQLMLRTVDKSSEQYEDLKTIEKHARMCKVIVEDLLKFSRATQTKKETVDIHRVIREVISMLDYQLRSSNIAVECSFDESAKWLEWDVNKMKQVFINMIVNAKDAIKRDGCIRIKTLRKNDKVFIHIEDNGCGIPREHLDKIFDPFFTTKPPGEGTGLGLAVSYGIITEHGGEIMVESEPNKGTVFTLIFPLAS